MNTNKSHFLKSCRHCGKEVSIEAKTCPNCGNIFFTSINDMAGYQEEDIKRIDQRRNRLCFIGLSIGGFIGLSGGWVGIIVGAFIGTIIGIIFFEIFTDKELKKQLRRYRREQLIKQAELEKLKTAKSKTYMPDIKCPTCHANSVHKITAGKKLAYVAGLGILAPA